MTPMRVLGLDIATTTGWAVMQGSSIRAGHWRAEGESEAAIMASFRMWVRGMLVSEAPDFVAIEAAKAMVPRSVEDKDKGGDAFGFKATKFVSNPKTDIRLNALNLLAQMTCHELGITFETVADSQHRKAFLGQGRFPQGKAKEEALKQCHKLGLPIKSKDAADAVSVAWWGAGRMKQARHLVNDLFKQG